ncbi:MAG: enoyl-CoA hydratase/isomerase family protein [Deltaproteobacteria bacterium]|jgi:enoyl-CoA hydratase|nr:enoyl-CoA hydratase/isomerase family protein [Deltaproteobacteria bacterium]
MPNGDFILTSEKGVALIEISLGRGLNVFDSKAVKGLSALIGELGQTDVRCLVLTALGEKAFVAGADLKEMMPMGRMEAKNLCLAGNKLMEKISAFPVPVIAAVNGYAIGGGLELALACDIRLASEKASFSLPEVSFGIIPGYGGIMRLSRLVGRGRASELIFTARRLGAREALDWGLINAVYPPTELLPEAMRMAQTIASKPPLAVASAKKVLAQSEGLEASKAYLLELGEFSNLFGTFDQLEAMRAFVEKRDPPPFKG